MSETPRIISLLALLILVYILTRRYHFWRIKRTYANIVNDLRQQGALDPQSAVHLPYAKAGWLHMGTRDYRPRALEYLVAAGVVGMNQDGGYYLSSPQFDDDRRGPNPVPGHDAGNDMTKKEVR